MTFRIILSHALLFTLVTLPQSLAANIDQVTAVGEKRAANGKATQEKVDRLSDATDSLEEQYRQTLKVVEGLHTYNGLLEKQVTNQLSELDALKNSLEQVSLIERQIVPLMVKMIDSLARFVELDVPFLPAERSQRIARLQALLERADVTTSEKFRTVLEAYQIESDYGRTIEAYTGSLTRDGVSKEVNFLRIGRIALLYQSGSGETGVWNAKQSQWQALSRDRYQREVINGLKIARKQAAPDLLVVPVPAAQEVR